MPIPITPEDFIKIGERYASEDIVKEIDRLLPLATADLGDFAGRGYGPDELADLTKYRGTLTAESADVKQQRATKKGARFVETDAIGAAKLVLRSGAALAHAALTHRKPAPGETAEQTRQTVLAVTEQIDTLGGRIGNDSAKLRTKLASLTTVLGLPALAPSTSDSKPRAAFVAKVQAAIAELPTLAEQKKGAQQGSKAGTGSLDEIDGRAYTNLKSLTEVGRAYWNEAGNRARAAEYQLTALHPRSPRKQKSNHEPAEEKPKGNHEPAAEKPKGNHEPSKGTPGPSTRSSG